MKYTTCITNMEISEVLLAPQVAPLLKQPYTTTGAGECHVSHSKEIMDQPSAFWTFRSRKARVAPAAMSDLRAFWVRG